MRELIYTQTYQIFREKLKKKEQPNCRSEKMGKAVEENKYKVKIKRLV